MRQAVCPVACTAQGMHITTLPMYILCYLSVCPSVCLFRRAWPGPGLAVLYLAGLAAAIGARFHDDLRSVCWKIATLKICLYYAVCTILKFSISLASIRSSMCSEVCNILCLYVVDWVTNRSRTFGRNFVQMDRILLVTIVCCNDQ